MLKHIDDELSYNFIDSWGVEQTNDVVKKSIYLYHISHGYHDMDQPNFSFNSLYTSFAPSIIQCISGIANFSPKYSIYRTKEKTSKYNIYKDEPDGVITQEVLCNIYKNDIELVKIGEVNDYLSFCVDEEMMQDIVMDNLVNNLKFYPNLCARAVYDERFNQINEYLDMVALQKNYNWLSQWISDKEIQLHKNNHTRLYR